MEAPLPAYTRTWRNTSYDAISPLRPELSAAGKTIVITGASAGIGARTARSFAEAGAAHIAILARRENLLLETKNSITAAFPGTGVSTHVADVTDADALARTAREVGAWDVLVLNAGFLPQREPLLASDPGDWWKGFEVNLKGTLLALQAFMPSRKARAAVVGITSGVVTLPSEMMVKGTSYTSSKLAVVKLLEIFAAENPDVHVGILHPGVVETEMFIKGDFKGLPIDDASLPADFMVWSVSPEAAFTNGKYLAVNWDVNELKEKAKEIQETPVLSSGLLGHPWTN